MLEIAFQHKNNDNFFFINSSSVDEEINGNLTAKLRNNLN